MTDLLLKSTQYLDYSSLSWGIVNPKCYEQKWMPQAVKHFLGHLPAQVYTQQNIEIHLFYTKWWTLQCWTHLLFLKTIDGHQILSNGEGENKSTNDKRLKEEEDSCVRAHLCRLFCCKILLKILTVQLYVPRNLTLELQII